MSTGLVDDSRSRKIACRTRPARTPRQPADDHAYVVIMNVLLVIHIMATWFMVGLIWTIQVVHYPLFQRVGAASFPSYEAEHTRRMGWLLAGPASLEVSTAAALVWFRPSAVGLGLVLTAGVILAGLWVTTALRQVPLHRQLTTAPTTAAIRRLVDSNWFRTAGWTLRGILVSTMLLQVI